MRRLVLGALGLAAGAACATASGVGRSASSSSRLSEADAVRLAEQFVADNGYTFAPLATSAKPRPEPIEQFAAMEQNLRARRGTLAPRACGVVARNVRSDRDGWTVTFCYDGWYARQLRWQAELARLQRAVVMEPDGSGITVVHEDLPERIPRKKLRAFEEQPPRREISEDLALTAAIQYVLRNGFVAGYENNPGRDWPVPSERTARVKATPRLPLWNLPCAVIPRDLRRGQEGWSVGFCYDVYVMTDRHLTLADADKRLRLVTMDRYGEAIDMADEDGDWDLPGLKRLRDPPRCTAETCR